MSLKTLYVLQQSSGYLPTYSLQCIRGLLLSFVWNRWRSWVATKHLLASWYKGVVSLRDVQTYCLDGQLAHKDGIPKNSLTFHF